MAIHLFARGYEDALEFADLPMGLKFSFSRQEIQNKFAGLPLESGGGMDSPMFGWTSAWERYTFENVTLHFSYSRNNNSIELVTIGKLSNS